MEQDRNFFEERLSKQAEITPFKASPKRVTVGKDFLEKMRIDEELAKRFDEATVSSQPEPELSNVEKAMRRNAPDLAGAPENEVRAAEERRTAHVNARWPRPRSAAMVIIALVMWLHPVSTIQLFACTIFLFLVVAVAIGPERARDGGFHLCRRFLRYWKVELSVAGRFMRKRLPTHPQAVNLTNRHATVSPQFRPELT